MDFYWEQRKKQKQWRKDNGMPKELGFQNGKRYKHVLPRAKWEESLWDGIRKTLPAFIRQKNIKAHSGTHNLLSSWVLSANLYFPILYNPSMRDHMLQFLIEHVSNNITEITDIELEFAFPVGDPLHPANLLGESAGTRGSGQTSPDVALLVKTKNGDGIVLIECKYTEHSFYTCSARTKKDSSGRKGNSNPERCMISKTKDEYKKICNQIKWIRKYWDHIELSENASSILKRCPAATAGYQLFRQQALANGIAKSGRFDLVASGVAFDGRNDILKSCLRTTGISDFTEGWKNLFEDNVKFFTWPHQDWVEYVRINGTDSLQKDWVKYMNNRYGY